MKNREVAFNDQAACVCTVKNQHSNDESLNMLRGTSFVLSEKEPLVAPGLVEFDSLEKMRKYVKQLLDSYQRESDRLGDATASMMRDAEMGDAGKDKLKSFPKIWQKKGSLEVDIDDVPWKDAVTTMAPTIENSTLLVSQGAGWGIDVNEEEIRRHPWPR